jgi:hypothetical protein
MKVACVSCLLFVLLAFAACNKDNQVSKIPHISLIQLVPNDSMIVNIDTCYIVFNLTDGDGDLGNDSVSGIYLRDSRFPGFGYNPFPQIDPAIEDPKKGLSGSCILVPVPQPAPRTDSLHMATGDTLYYEFYIKDRAGDTSNHIITHTLIVRP